MATASVCSSPSERTDGVTCLELQRNEACSDQQVLPFRSGFVATSDRPNPLSIGEPPESLGLGDTCTTSLRLRAGRFATVEAATRLARLRSDLAAAAGPSLGSAKAPALATAWRCLVRCQSHVPVLPVRPHDARARARILVASFVLTDFVHFPEFSVRTVTP